MMVVVMLVGMIVAASILGGIITDTQTEGGLDANAVEGRARAALAAHGRAVIRASCVARLLGAGPLELDRHGFTVNARWRRRRAYAWAEVRQPFAVIERARSRTIVVRAIAFTVLTRTGIVRSAWGWRRRRSVPAFTAVQRRLPSCSAIGATRLVALMNELRSQALAEAARQQKSPRG